ncbi:E3 ubiquitin-protein ligase UBR3-like [Planoprotostelium fungivorum]|uniref:E3 ubiquitin-protein ligase n=1 Tax=Planoprotostelium fungivorum TaxID=1890364 RepID=A0A2P6NC45_9EUKA|nr:E3 ubiquitin-protein ligase UBR3-like [Planoprotostelium fungivorum]
MDGIIEDQVQNAPWQPEIVDLCGTLLIGESVGVDYETILKNLEKSTTVCGVSWKRDALIVTCKTCGLDPTCAICMPCFQNGNHEGHDYNIHSSSGGMCDCGDPQAWQTSGFCSKHSGVREEVDPMELLPHHIVENVRTLCHTLWKRIMNDVNHPTSLRVIQWLNHIQQFGEGLRYLIGESMTSPSHSPTILPTLISGHTTLVTSPTLRRELIALYTSLIVDYTFKQKFTGVFMDHYVAIAKGSSSKLSSLSVQLLTVPKIVLQLARENRLDNLVDCYWGCLEQMKDASTGLLDPEKEAVRDDEHFRIHVDIRYTVQNASVSQYIVWHDRRLLGKFISMVAVAHGMVPHVRKTDIHILHEKEDAVSLEFHLIRIMTLLAEGFTKGDDTLSGAPLRVPEAIKRMREIINDFQLAFNAWYTGVGAQYYPMDHKVSHGPNSVHLTIHRSLALFLRSCTSSWNISLSKLLTSDVCSRILQEPMRAQVMMSQVQNRMWVRNGHSVLMLSNLYKTSQGRYAHHSSGNDIYLLQVCAAVMGPENFLESAIRIWEMKDYFDGNFNERDEYLKRNVESFMSFLVQLLGDTMLLTVNQSPAAVLRRLIIHKLAQEPAVHSALEKAIPDPWNKLPHFDQILHSVAQIQRSTTGGKKFELKPASWREFEGRNFSYYSAAEATEAVEAYNEAKKSFTEPFNHPTLYYLVQKGSDFPRDLRTEISDTFTPIVTSQYLHSDLLFKIVRQVLFNFKEDRASELAVEQALYILLLQVRAEPGFQSRNLFEMLRETYQGTTMLQVIMELCGRSDSEMGPLASHVIYDINSSDPICSEYIKKAGRKREEGKDEENEEDRKQALNARKAKLLAQMEQQRKVFASSVDDMDFEDEETMEEEPAAQCCLCKESVIDGEDSPMGIICHVTLAAVQIWDAKSQLNLKEPDSRLTNTTCGHHLHHSCHTNYVGSLQSRSRNRQPYEGNGYINLERCEFLCPQCRRLSNCLLPHGSQLQRAKGESISQWIESHSGQRPTSSHLPFDLESTTGQFHKSFISSLIKISPRKGEVNPFHYVVQTTINTISSVELLLRGTEGVSFQYDLLSDKLLDAIRGMVSTSFSVLPTVTACDGSRWIYLERYWPALFGTIIQRPSSSTSSTTNNAISHMLISWLKSVIVDITNNDTNNTTDDTNDITTDDTNDITTDDTNDDTRAEEKSETERSVLDQDAFTLFASVLFSATVLHDHQIPSEQFTRNLLKVMLKIVSIQCNEAGLSSPACLPFLRKVFLLLKCQSTTNENIRNLGAKISSSPSEISGLLSVVDGIFDESSDMDRLVEWWKEHPQSTELSTPIAFQFPEFPAEFHSLLLSYDQKICENCMKAPEHPVLCFFCMKMFCLGQKCCQDPETKEGEVIKHVDTCSGGRGIIFMVKECGVFLIKQKKSRRNLDEDRLLLSPAGDGEAGKVNGCMWSSIYLDKYGEEDPMYRRGKPLYLSSERIESLRQMWLNGELEQEVNRKSGLNPFRL